MSNRSGRLRKTLISTGALMFVLRAAAGCADVDSSSSSEEGLDTPAPTAADAAPLTLSPADAPLDHPYRELAERGGPLPLFEALDDASGQRYVIGVSGGVASEDAPFVRGSTVTTMRRVPAEDSGKARPSRRGPRVRTAPAERITPDLAATLEGAAAGDRVPVEISLVKHDAGLQVELDRRMAEGRIRTPREKDLAVERFIERRRQDNAARLAPLTAIIEKHGGRVIYPCENQSCLVADLPAGAVPEIARHSEVVELDSVRQPLPAGISGETVRDGCQIEQFFDPVIPQSSASYDGEGLNETSSSDDLVVAVIEAEAPGFANHVGYGETATISRIVKRWSCNGSCSEVASYASASSHATGVAGILFGDLTDGQGNFPGADRVAGSGYAPEARAHLYAVTSGLVAALDHATGLTTSRPDIINNSWGVNESPMCSGASSTARNANGAYLDGIAVFSAAHNNGGGPSDCKVTAPGSAIGDFTVGAHINPVESDPDTFDGIDDVRGGPIRGSSSWGGNSTQGQNRSLVSLTGPSTRTHKFNNSGTLSDSGVVCCTSLATPTVASAAMAYMDFYRHRWSSYIDNPGALYANMLLMGDRQGQSGKVAGANQSPDHRWGMGRMRMRMTGNGQLDAPWVFFSGETCISDGETWEMPVGDGPLSSDADVFKFAAYWYDHRHDGSDGGSPGAVADVDVRLRDTGTQTTLASDLDSFDNKARLYYNGVGGKQLAVRFSGFDVEGHDDPVCGSNSIRVFFSFFYEDSDRESPTFNLMTGEGVFPESL